jgi:hypothetical protein
MPDIEYIRAEIERMRIPVHRRRGGDQAASKSWYSNRFSRSFAKSDVNNIDGLCPERYRLKGQQPGPTKGEGAGRASVVRDGLEWYDHKCRQPLMDQSLG